METTAPNNGLDCGHGGAFGILFADAAGDGSGGRHTESEGDAEDQHQHRFGESDGSQRVGAEASDPQRVDHAEGGLHRHFEQGGDGQERDSAAEARFGEILTGAGERFAHQVESRLHTLPFQLWG